MVCHVFGSICFLLFVCMFSLCTINGQVVIDKYVHTVDLDVDSIENCFGYKLLKCNHFYIYRNGLYQKNKTVVEFEYDEKGEITNFELSSNNNYSLDSQEIANCVLPFINLRPTKSRRRYKRYNKDKIMLIFDNEISRKNEEHFCMISLRKTKENTIDQIKERRRLKNQDWELNIMKFNTLVNDNDAESIFNKLEEQSNEMLNEQLKYCDRHGTQLDKQQHNYQPLETRIKDSFQMILHDYFK